MGRPKSPYGYSASRYNRMTHGVMIHDILPSRGLDRCPLAEGCPCWDDDLRPLCVPGEPCPWELWFIRRYADSGREQFQRCLRWLSETDRDHIIHELGVLSLRRRRLSALVAKEGLLVEKRHPVSGVVYGLKEGLGVGRYATAIDNQFWPLYSQLVFSPEEQQAAAEAEQSDEPLILPFHLPASTEAPAKEVSTYTPKFTNRTKDWFPMPRAWDHPPGSPDP